MLTDEEKLLLQSNTDELIQRMESEYQAVLQQQEAQRVQLDLFDVEAAAQPPKPPASQPDSTINLVSFHTDETVSEAEAIAIIQKRFKFTPTTVGWNGLIVAVMNGARFHKPI